MDSTGPKHKHQFPPQQDEDQEIYGLPVSKRPRMDNNGEEIEMLFALVDRLRETIKMLKHKGATSGPAEATSTEGKIMTSKSLWKPSLEWEDFSWDYGASVWEEIQKLDIGSGDGGMLCSSDKQLLVRSFDLNAEAPSELPVFYSL